MKKSRLKNLRCPECGTFTDSLLTGRCAECVRRIEAQSGDWLLSQVLVRTFHRHDRRHLKLTLRRDDTRGDWTLDGSETDEQSDRRHSTRIGRYPSLIAGVAFGEQFGRRWIEKTAGTSIATYVPRPQA